MSGRAIIAVVTAAGLGLGGCGSAALETAKPSADFAPGAATVIFDCAGRGHARPAGLILYCGDAGEFLSGLRWRHWGAGTATAIGTLQINTCTPNCAAGHTRTSVARVTARGLSLNGTAAGYSTLEVANSSGQVSRRYTYSTYSLTINGPVPR